MAKDTCAPFRKFSLQYALGMFFFNFQQEVTLCLLTWAHMKMLLLLRYEYSEYDSDSSKSNHNQQNEDYDDDNDYSHSKYPGAPLILCKNG